MSRYNFDGGQDRSHGTVILLTPPAGSRYPHYKVVMGAGTKAKTMTSLLILPALLAKVFVVFGQPRLILRPQSFSFFSCH